MNDEIKKAKVLSFPKKGSETQRPKDGGEAIEVEAAFWNFTPDDPPRAVRASGPIVFDMGPRLSDELPGLSEVRAVKNMSVDVNVDTSMIREIFIRAYQSSPVTDPAERAIWARLFAEVDKPR
jgi:hypothetical protein